MSNLKLSSDWDIIVGRGATRVSGVEMVAQLVKSRLLTLFGEWQQDTSLGLPWFEAILTKNARPADIQLALANVIRTTTHVRQLINITVDANYQTRMLTVSFSALSDFGDIEEVLDWLPPTA